MDWETFGQLARRGRRPAPSTPRQLTPLTPFGFQSERRTLWEAPEIYQRLSPFMHAHQIREPLLLIHGARDDNPGTFPMQSDRMYQAVRGNGGHVRFVSLPHESHGYLARESVEQITQGVALG